MTHDDAKQLEEIAKRIDTGNSSPDTSRALVVFNLSVHSLSGIAVFRASMSWPIDQPLPPIAVTTMDGGVVAVAICDLPDAPDIKGRRNHRLLSFDLHFAVADIPARGWRTYLASYTDAPSPTLENGTEITDLIVVETTRHGGDLLPLGNF